MKCRQVADLISSYVDETLPPDRADAIRAHTAECAACSAELAAERASVEALESPRKILDAPDLLAEIKSRVAEPRRQPVRPRWQWAFAGVAAACCLVWLGITLTHEDAGSKQVATTSSTVQSVQPPAADPVPPTVQKKQTAAPPAPKHVAPAASKVRHQQPIRHIVRAPKPKPRHIEERPATPAPSAGPLAPEIEYLVVYNHSGLGGGIAPDEPADGEEDGSTSTEPSAYSISMTDESTGEVTNVSAYGKPGDESGERATVRFRGSTEAPVRDERERSSTDEKPLDCAGGADHCDLC